MSLWAAAALTLLATAPVDGRRALVVALNDSPHPALAPLQYADDDGLLWTEVLERLGYDTVLLTVPDLDTARRGSPLLSRAQAPTLEALRAAVARLRAANQRDRARGQQTDTLVVYVGHGDVDESGRAYLTLLSTRLYRETLFAEVVDPLDAAYVHLIVDACHASGVVGSRGGDPAVLEKLGRLLDQEAARARPTLGTAFAESETGQTHEWSRIRAGVFSHVLRSALLGAADVNRDGRVEYSELQGFAAAALAGVSGAPARLEVRLSAPSQDPRRPLVEGAPEGPQLWVPATLPQVRLSISDEQGTRLIDLHRLPGEAALLRLPARPAYWISSPDAEARVRADELGAGFPPLSTSELAFRGGEAESLQRGLFQVAFGRPFYDGFVAQARLVPVPFEQVTADPALEAPRLWSRGWTGVEFGLSMGQAPLGVSALSGGPFIAWRSATLPLRFGGRASYGISPRAWIGRATLHRLTVLATAGYEGPQAFTPTAELGAGISLIGVTGAMGPQADLTVPGARFSVGARWRLGEFTFRAGLSLSSDYAELDGLRRLVWLPALDLGVER